MSECLFGGRNDRKAESWRISGLANGGGIYYDVAQMPKKTYIFRCPADVLEELVHVCESNDVDFSRVLTSAIIMYTDWLAEAGCVEVVPVPPCRLKDSESENRWSRKSRVSVNRQQDTLCPISWLH